MYAQLKRHVDEAILPAKVDFFGLNKWINHELRSIVPNVSRRCRDYCISAYSLKSMLIISADWM